MDSDPSDRTLDRCLAANGQLQDAKPLFGTRQNVARAGVLLAVPFLVASGVFDAAKDAYGSIGPAFYGLRTTIVTLLLLTLLRVKHPENVKEYNPVELGRIIGPARAPEVKTIRSKLKKLSRDERKLDAFLQDLVQRRVRTREEALGFLYVDGHVRVYTGESDLPKTHVARMRICLPATQDVWVNDAEGAPLFFVTQEAHPSLVTALENVLKRVRAEVGDKRRVTVVFDRGGFSPALFKKMYDDGFDVLTYQKGKFDCLPESAFTTYPAPGTNGGKTYDLADNEIKLSNGFSMRQVVRRKDGKDGKDQHQTPILTTRRDLSAADVAFRMFERWRQENFFKYMREEYAIDALVEYGEEPDDIERLVPNPARKTVEKQLQAARAKLKALEAVYGAAALDHKGKRRKGWHDFKVENITTGRDLWAARYRVAELMEKRRVTPLHVELGTVKKKPVVLPRLRKRLCDGLKMLAYQVETDLFRLVAPYYKRAEDEGRTLLCAALQSAADIEVGKDELRITLAPQSSPHRTLAISKLCGLLNDTATRFPGTNLRLHFAVHGAQA